jgi:hypothetical protein
MSMLGFGSPLTAGYVPLSQTGADHRNHQCFKLAWFCSAPLAGFYSAVDNPVDDATKTDAYA